MALWNPDEQYELDPNTGQYAQQQMQAPQPAGIDWGSVEQQLRAKGGNLYDPSDLEGIQRNTGYNEPGKAVSLDPALQTQFGIYDQRASSNGGQQAAPQYQTPAQQWNAQPSANVGRSDELYKLLMQRATQGTAVNRDDPNIRAQVDPVVAQQERASRNYIDDIAEKSGPLANIQGERRLAAERGGQAAGAFESEVIGREIAAKRDEIAQALQLYGSRLTAEQQLEMQQQLAQLDAALQREGYGVQREGLALQRYGMDQSNDEFMRELALREYDLGNTWDYRWQTGGV
jgi:hypothetical protein